MQQEFAETQAVRVLGWLAAQDELLPVFLGASGASLGDMRARAADPDFLASVLDFILMDDEWVLGCARALDMAPERIVGIRQALPGGSLPNWT